MIDQGTLAADSASTGLGLNLVFTSAEMMAAFSFLDHDLAEQIIGYINATSTCDCTFRAGFARQSVQVPMDARVKDVPDQRLGA